MGTETVCTEERTLRDGIKRLTRTLADFLDVPMDKVIVVGPSRHIVVKSEDGKVIAKSYRDQDEESSGYDRLLAERQNVVAFGEVNRVRTPTYRKVTGLDSEYLGLPAINTKLLDTSRLVGPVSHLSIAIFNVIPGQLLYDKTLKGTATFEDYLAAAVQIARIQQEGKSHKDIKLENIVRDRRAEEQPTSYFMRRFERTFLRQIIRYGDIEMPQTIQDEMAGEWETVVAQNLLKVHQQGFTGYYFDGNPKHHLFGTNGTRVVSIDYEYKRLTPSLLGLASLLHFGLGKDGKPFFEDSAQEKILDRYLLETEFVEALRTSLYDRAGRIADYIKQADANDHKYSVHNPDEFYRFLGRSADRDDGVVSRNRFLAAWKFAVLDRQSSWLAHKARYRAIAKTFSDEGFQFEHPDPVAQNATEQRQHLQQIKSCLESIRSLNGKNGRETQNAAMGLCNKIDMYFANNPYFHQQ